MYNDAGQVNQYEHQNSANYVYNDADDEVPIIDDSDMPMWTLKLTFNQIYASVEAELKLKSIQYSSKSD